ncbi:hypothetical protein BLS_008468 [Venturia inaequalis]|uniref:Uncharacterized protein n=1 Tax=Venturia inaequalis TaxID=5025 RepID=A0A8H3YNT1_VENIN|nr:hypothetical protein BLS_008468 [Venturia inaequalis]KAE9976638.1 hypothetical protein EG328_002536 [Venturia inaequalis]KAE9993622.1 hypothetical protein EG327_004143 [Venturia inaequalis]RDI82183.1 hypothetical protein Vi05172_g7766 [Venturia inaequalis]
MARRLLLLAPWSVEEDVHIVVGRERVPPTPYGHITDFINMYRRCHHRNHFRQRNSVKLRYERFLSLPASPSKIRALNWMNNPANATTLAGIRRRVGGCWSS